MNLQSDIKLFTPLCISVASEMNIADAGIIEKDYFVTLFLKQISKTRPDIIFKGGTSLSKCYKAIERFSEDIDLTVEIENAKLTESQRKIDNIITCKSAQDDVKINELLKKILENDFFKKDYNKITSLLLFNKLPYTDAIKVLEKIIKDSCF